jgi:anti-sigma B factor antagonist
MAALEIAERRNGPVTVVELTGRLVADDGENPFAEQIRVLVAAGNVNLLVDLHRVTYMDSGGVGALVSMFLHVAKRGGRLKLLAPSDRVRRVLQITRLLQIFEVFADEEEAVHSFEMPSVLPQPARQAIAGL